METILYGTRNNFHNIREIGTFQNIVMKAAADNHVKLLEILATTNINIYEADVNMDNALHIACRRNNYEAVKRLFTFPGININICGGNSENPLHIASKNGYCQILELLLSVPIIDVNATGLDR